LKSYKFYLCDVFTRQRFGGNQLAVLPQADGLTTARMQQIAREFNFSESTFVFPPDHGNTRHVRIFTPRVEVPFAGHPNIGTAFVLAQSGELGDYEPGNKIVFEEQAGLVPLTLSKTGPDQLYCELQAPQPLSLGKTVPVKIMEKALSLPQDSISVAVHLPQVASVGLPFVIAELKDLSTLEAARINTSGFEEIAEMDITPDLFIYVRSQDEFDIRARMFAPFDGVEEDPATGSANCALMGLLALHDEQAEGTMELNIAQGIEMGRPSFLQARAEKNAGETTGIWIGGECVLVAEGQIYVD
jgi:trans-2,3-dihydro-3-hydroxyanthranilate isomerase